MLKEHITTTINSLKTNTQRKIPKNTKATYRTFQTKNSKSYENLKKLERNTNFLDEDTEYYVFSQKLIIDLLQSC